jgi:hypothetical protein
MRRLEKHKLQSAIGNVTPAGVLAEPRRGDSTRDLETVAAQSRCDSRFPLLIFVGERQVGRLESLPTHDGGALGIPQIAKSRSRN